MFVRNSAKNEKKTKASSTTSITILCLKSDNLKRVLRAAFEPAERVATNKVGA